MELGKTVSDVIKFREEFTEYVAAIRSHHPISTGFAEARNFSIETVNNAGVFYTMYMAELMHPRFLDRIVDFGIISPNNNMPIYERRWVIPLMDSMGMVAGLVGYKADAHERYVYSTTKYYRRRETFFGMQNIYHILEKGWGVVTEGITDCMRMWDIGVLNCISTCGSHNSKEQMEFLSKIPKVVFIPDRDKSGDITKNYWRTKCSTRLSIPMYVKDVDQYCKEYEHAKDTLLKAIEYCVYSKMKSDGNFEVDIVDNQNPL